MNSETMAMFYTATADLLFNGAELIACGPKYAQLDYRGIEFWVECADTVIITLGREEMEYRGEAAPEILDYIVEAAA